MQKKKDYCTLFPESWRGKDISMCCKQHDNDCGEAGSFNIFRHTLDFYRCLRNNTQKPKYAFMIAAGGFIGELIKYPWFVYRKIKYRKQK